jgi:SRSO17 transposase
LEDAYLRGMSEGSSFDAAMERRFQEYVEDLGAVVGNDARRRGLSDYMTGLLLPGERKSMEPIAERLESGNVSRRHQATSISSAKPVGRTAPCESGCSVGSCR